MKALVLALLAVLLAASGCAPGVKEIPTGGSDSTQGMRQNAVAAIGLSDREELFLSALSDRYYTFEFSAGGEYKWMTIWVDEYQNGEKIQRVLDHTTGLAEQSSSGKILFVLPKLERNDEQALKILVEANGEEDTQYIVLPDSAGYSLFGGGAVGSAEISGDMLLACIRYSRDDEFAPLSEEFFRGYKSRLEEISGDGLTYIFGCSFSANKPEHVGISLPEGMEQTEYNIIYYPFTFGLNLENTEPAETILDPLSFYRMDAEQFKALGEDYGYTFGEVRTAREAADVAAIVFSKIFEQDPEEEAPYGVYFNEKANAWIVNGSMPSGWVGGVFTMAIDAKTGEILALIHGK